MKNKLEQIRHQNFLRGLYNRAILGETLKAGESYIFLNTCGVEEDVATQADVDKINSQITIDTL